MLCISQSNHAVDAGTRLNERMTAFFWSLRLSVTNLHLLHLLLPLFFLSARDPPYGGLQRDRERFIIDDVSRDQFVWYLFMHRTLFAKHHFRFLLRLSVHTSITSSIFTMASSTKFAKKGSSRWQFIIHGGCSESCPDVHRQREISRNLHEIAEKVSKALEEGSSAKDAVVLAVSALEDCPVFNAGHGAALNQDGIHQVS